VYGNGNSEVRVGKNTAYCNYQTLATVLVLALLHNLRPYDHYN